MFRFVVGLMALVAATAAAAQTPQVPPEKQALVQRVLARMSMDSVGLAMLQKPIADQVLQARTLMQGRGVAPDRQEAAIKDINAEASKVFEEQAALVRASTRQVMESSVAPLLAQRFSDEELKQLAAILESPVLAKFEAVTPEIKKTVGENVAKANQAQVNARLTELQAKIGLRVRAALMP